MDTAERILRESTVIAVVGLSDSPDRPSHGVARYMQEHGYRIIPVNPKLTEPVLGEQPYARLEDIPEHVDVVDIFRRAVAVPPVVDGAIRIGADAVWMQLGISHGEAGAKAEAAGLRVVMDKCMLIEHRLMKDWNAAPRSRSRQRRAPSSNPLLPPVDALEAPDTTPLNIPEVPLSLLDDSPELAAVGAGIGIFDDSLLPDLPEDDD